MDNATYINIVIGERVPGTYSRHDSTHDGDRVRAVNAPGNGAKAAAGEDGEGERTPGSHVSPPSPHLKLVQQSFTNSIKKDIHTRVRDEEDSH